MVSDLSLKHRNKLTKMLYRANPVFLTISLLLQEIYLVRTLPTGYAFNPNFNETERYGMVPSVSIILL
jgi:hypothetical protein